MRLPFLFALAPVSLPSRRFSSVTGSADLLPHEGTIYSTFSLSIKLGTGVVKMKS
jgi:hypothetical protein